VVMVVVVVVVESSGVVNARSGEGRTCLETHTRPAASNGLTTITTTTTTLTRNSVKRRESVKQNNTPRSRKNERIVR
jgi:hypothetical protein